MSHLSETLEKLLARHDLTAHQIAIRSEISPSQLSKWMCGKQTSISEKHLTALAKTISKEPADQAELVLAHLQDEKFGPGSDLIEITLNAPVRKAGKTKSPAKTSKAPVQSKGDEALSYLAQERLRNREVNSLLVDLARVLGAKL